METKILKSSSDDITAAAKILRSGGLVAIPTETVYGLAANALDESAVARIFKAKGRPQDNPLIVHVSKIADALPLVEDFPETARSLAEKFWPGPLTLVLKKSHIVPDIVSAGLDTVAVRVPSHPVALAVIAAAGIPLAAPSANISGSPSPTAARHVLSDLDGKIDAIIDGGNCRVGVESTVLSLCGQPRLLRPGWVSVAEIQAVIGKVDVDRGVLRELSPGQPAASPGMKHKHYAPRAKAVLVEADSRGFAEYVTAQVAASGQNCAALCFDEDVPLLSIPVVSLGKSGDYSAQARRLFAALRQLDDSGAQMIFAHAPEKDGVGLAVYNRLLRACGFNLIDN